MADSTTDLPPMIGASPRFAAMLDQVSRLAPLDRPVVIAGERGTGKELVAARLHYLSPRWDCPFVQVNCGALSESLLESELFGHEAGAFTGAARRRAGRFEQADRGTLFLDEIASASLSVQEAILRVVEYGTFERLGGSATQRVDVRVIAAANVDLPSLAAAGRFRADLLDRLAFEVVTVPPLRERREDIMPLAEHFALGMTRALRRDFFAGFGREAASQLLAHRWPGNVRELRNVVERAVARNPRPDRPVTEIVLDPFAAPGRPAPPATPESEPAAEAAGGDLVSRVSAFEASLLRDALARNAHHQGRTAAELGLTYHQLRHYLRKHGLLRRARA